MYVCDDNVCDPCCDFCWYCVHGECGDPIQCAKWKHDFEDGVGYCDEFKCRLHEPQPHDLTKYKINERMVKIKKEEFVVIGKEGSTIDGEGFIQKLWNDANGHFDEIAHLAKKNANGDIVGIWGAMSDISRSFKPWEDGFSKGLYLAGVECVDHAEVPDGWTKWVIPGYEYIVVENHDGAFNETIGQMNEEDIFLAGAVHDYTDPVTGKDYLYFPIRKI